MLLAEKVALVTGAGRGIGRAIALDLAENGAKVVVNYRSNTSAAAEVVAAIEASGGEAVALQCDVSDFSSVQTLAKQTLQAFGQIDILVNNAGTTRDTLLARMREEDWDTIIDTNLKSVFNCCKAVIRPMLRRKQGGRIINISSASGIIAPAGQANYAASKAGIHAFTKSLAREVGSRNITVNAVAPGFIPTDLTASMSERDVEQVVQLTALGRVGQSRDVAHLVTFLASDRAGYITGEIIRVDGGLAM